MYTCIMYNVCNTVVLRILEKYVSLKKHMQNLKPSNRLMIFKVCCFITRMPRSCWWCSPSACRLVFGGWAAVRPSGSVVVSTINPQRRCGERQEQNQGRRDSQNLASVQISPDLPSQECCHIKQSKGKRACKALVCWIKPGLCVSCFQGQRPGQYFGESAQLVLRRVGLRL